MATPPSLALELWREACRHLEIEESAPTLARILSKHVPIVALEVDTFDWERGVIRTRARVDLHDPPSRLPAPRRMSAEEEAALKGWLEKGAVSKRPGGKESESPSLLWRGRSRQSWIAAPLWTEHGAAGALLLRYARSADVEAEQVERVESLIEPFSVAIENDRRLLELKALREASDAERRSVLARLGRDDLVETIIGRDGGLRGVMQRVALVAASDVPVLILGETGSGKEVIARAIHEQSPRSANPFIRVNCGAIPPELVDSELFGHERGAFTGATASRRGWFERADTGTLLLDEVAELPLSAQVRLLRVLQEGVFERMGGERSVRVDVRIVAATHRDLPTMVRHGRFREDLWYRITGFPVLLPPLRDRREDIPDLARHFVERAARRFGLRPLALTPADIELLSSYSWPGNIRELASVVDRAAILGAGESLEVARALGGNLLAAAPLEPVGSAQATGGDPRTLDQVVREHIELALRAARGRIEGSEGIARMLGVNPHTLRARMRKLGIDWARYRVSR